MTNDDIIIRECETRDELHACVSLQREVFALPEIEISPVRHFIVTKNAGGFTLGAYAGEDLIGFVLSVPAVLRDEKAFYSHMTAVRKSYQGSGIGARLKWAQRLRAVYEGAGFIKWTFQPVLARNAFFNLEKLGAEIREYEPNFYGTDYSTAHNEGGSLGIDSDRLFAEWHLSSEKVVYLAGGEEFIEERPLIREIDIPNNWDDLVRNDIGKAIAEQDRIKAEFGQAFGRVWYAAGFAVMPIAPPICYTRISMPLFDIDPDIRRAHTLSSGFYTDPGNFEASRERIFARTWHYIGETEKNPGLTPVNILDGFLDEPVLISKKDGITNCLSNVCTHRGKILIENACDASLIRCGYHGRRFSMDGKFLSMPEFEGVENFPGERDNLPRVPFGTWNGFGFASPSPAAPLEDFITEMTGRVDERPFEFAGRKEYEIGAHWALYCENYLEGFHIPFVHQSLNEVVDYGTYSTETFRYSSLQTGFDKQGNSAAQYFFIFPNMMFNFYPWGLSVNIVKPVGPGNSRVEFLTFISDGSKIEQGAGADLHRVEMEDEAVVESVQRGIRSRFYDRGRYSPAREQGTHHFHRLIAEFMG